MGNSKSLFFRADLGEMDIETAGLGPHWRRQEEKESDTLGASLLKVPSAAL